MERVGETQQPAREGEGLETAAAAKGLAAAETARAPIAVVARWGWAVGEWSTRPRLALEPGWERRQSWGQELAPKRQAKAAGGCQACQAARQGRAPPLARRAGLGEQAAALPLAEPVPRGLALGPQNPMGRQDRAQGQGPRRDLCRSAGLQQKRGIEGGCLGLRSLLSGAREPAIQSRLACRLQAAHKPHFMSPTHMVAGVAARVAGVAAMAAMAAMAAARAVMAARAAGAAGAAGCAAGAAAGAAGAAAGWAGRAGSGSRDCSWGRRTQDHRLEAEGRRQDGASTNRARPAWSARHVWRRLVAAPHAERGRVAALQVRSRAQHSMQRSPRLAGTELCGAPPVWVPTVPGGAGGLITTPGGAGRPGSGGVLAPGGVKPLAGGLGGAAPCGLLGPGGGGRLARGSVREGGNGGSTKLGVPGGPGLSLMGGPSGSPAGRMGSEVGGWEDWKAFMSSRLGGQRGPMAGHAGAVPGTGRLKVVGMAGSTLTGAWHVPAAGSPAVAGRRRPRTQTQTRCHRSTLPSGLAQVWLSA